MPNEDKIIEQIAKIIDRTNSKPQVNMSEVVLIKLLDDLKSFVDKDKIDIDDYFKRLERVGVTKDLSKYLGRKKRLRIVFEKNE